MEFNEKCHASEVMEVLVEMKVVGSDSDIANIFVVASTSQALLLIPVTLSELRVLTLLNTDLPEAIFTTWELVVGFIS